MSRVCTLCGGIDHTRFYCRLAPRGTLRRWRLRTYGRHRYLWDEARRQWVAKHGSEHPCHYCGQPLTDNDTLLEQDLSLRKLTLDHLDARSRAPELRYHENNLIPACSSCNEKKGSRHHDEYLHICCTPLPSHARVEIRSPAQKRAAS